MNACATPSPQKNKGITHRPLSIRDGGEDVRGAVIRGTMRPRCEISRQEAWMNDTRCYRPLIIGRRGAVAANHPLAAQAGLLALRAGGNAVDGAVATALTLAVVEPMMSGLGGDAFYHVFDQATGP